ncbi:MAG: RluA family pseudouridine synthase [Weeksellaceae bacterium]|nr:RluA family pseudouridine synthase [Weeksellaceae bacterium]
MAGYTPQIVFEDNHLLIISKAAGDLVQGDKTGDTSLIDHLKAYIKQRDHKPGNVFLGLTHRLDRPTTGLVIFAKTSKALSRMNEKFKKRQIHKIYWAIVPKLPPGTPTEATLRHYLLKNPKTNRVTVYQHPGNKAQEAILHYNLLTQLDNYAALEIELETGRSHQIRAQLSKIGLPIKGDLKYGSPRSNTDGSIHLHARLVQFTHPVTKEQITVTAPAPIHYAIWQAVEQKV